MDRWVGKIAVVTGASSGIGAATVKALAAKGIVVVALARREEKLKEVESASEGKVYAKKCDLTNEQDIIGVFDWVEKTLGGVDILINNAGVLLATNLADGDSAAWKTMLDTNVLALSICTREALKTMRKRGDNGHIFHINSIVGHAVPSGPKIAMYSASKYAVTSLTESLRLELKSLSSNIKITSISPGRVITEMSMRFRSENLPSLPCIDVGDITDAIIYSLGTRPVVQVHEIIIQPIGQTM